MRKLLPTAVLLTALAFGVWHVAHDVADHPAVGDGRLHEVAPGVFVHRARATNAGVVITERSVVLIDAHGSLAGGRALSERVRATTPYPIEHLFLTGAEPVHAAGAALFRNVEIVSTERARDALPARASRYGETLQSLGLPLRTESPAPKPTRTMPDQAVVDIGGTLVEVRDTGTRHAPGAALVWLPEARVLFSGDALTTTGLPFTGEPFADTAIDAHGSWKRALETIQALRPLVLVPAHGPVLVGETLIAARVDDVMTVVDAASQAALATESLNVEEAVDSVVLALGPVLSTRKLDETFISRRMLALATVASLRDAGWRSINPTQGPVVARGDALKVLEDTDAQAALGRVRALVRRDDRALASTVVAEQLKRTPTASFFNGQRADTLLSEALERASASDRAEVAASALDAARRELSLTPREPFASLTLGCLSVWGSALTGESTAPAVADLERALASEELDRTRRRRAKWCLARAHAVAGHPEEAEAWLQAWLPAPVRFTYPLFATRLSVLP